MAVLRKHFPDSDKLVEKALRAYRRKQVAKDDILDALVAAVTGFLGKGHLISIPETPEFDLYGLPMEMVYHK
jgi:predicted RNase H-like nuclease